MSTITVAPSPNGSKPLTTSRVVPLLGPTIDHLLGLRALSRQAQEQERRMTADVIRAMEGAGVSRLDGETAAAVLEQRLRRSLRQRDGGQEAHGGRRP